MECASERKDAREIFQPFDTMRSYFCGIGFKIALQMVDLRSKLLRVAMKKNRRAISSQDLFGIYDDLDHILFDIRNFDDPFPEFYGRVQQVLLDLREGKFFVALCHLNNVLSQPKETVNPVPVVRLEEEPAILAS